jgi:hypothetical protein
MPFGFRQAWDPRHPKFILLNHLSIEYSSKSLDDHPGAFWKTLDDMSSIMPKTKHTFTTM